MTGPREPYRSGGGGVPDDAPTSNIPRVDPPSPETRSFRPVEGGDAAPGTQAFPPIGSEGAPTDQPNPDPGYPPAGDPTGGDPQGPTTAWSRYPEEQQVPGGPGASGPYPPPGSGPPGPPSGTGGPGDGSGGKGFPLWRFTGAIVALLSNSVVNWLLYPEAGADVVIFPWSLVNMTGALFWGVLARQTSFQKYVRTSKSSALAHSWFLLSFGVVGAVVVAIMHVIPGRKKDGHGEADAESEHAGHGAAGTRDHGPVATADGTTPTGDAPER